MGGKTVFAAFCSSFLLLLVCQKRMLVIKVMVMVMKERKEKGKEKEEERRREKMGREGRENEKMREVLCDGYLCESKEAIPRIKKEKRKRKREEREERKKRRKFV